MDALERTGITPITAKKLHAFAYLADVLSPVWGFVPYDGKILKMHDGPHYAELQKELDSLVILGLITVYDLEYVEVGEFGARVSGSYELNFQSEDLSGMLAYLGATSREDALDPRDSDNHQYLVELAGALSTLPDDEIDLAAKVDATYSNQEFGFSNVIEFDYVSTDRGNENKSFQITERFQEFLPEDSHLSPGEKVYLYAEYLGHQINA
ncbi:MAG: hypothetical protein GY816_00430 [Cytophagales bacterium]|nr:hypothetical protein [Cytophagales bacterium]